MNNYSAKKWIRNYFIVIIVFVPILFTFNYILDVFNIFHTSIFPKQFQTNERFNKIEYLDSHHHKYNSYIFGSSRIGNTLPSLIEKYIPNSKFYNMTVASANLYDYWMHLEYFIKSGYEVKNLYLEIDIDNMFSYGRIPNDYLRKMHPHVTDKSLLLYYLDYLSGFFPINSKKKLILNLSNHEMPKYNITTGATQKIKKEQLMELNCTKYIRDEYTFHKKSYRTMGLNRIEDTLEALKKIKDLCRDYKINLIIFTTPHHKKMMDGFKINDYLYFISEISKITDFYDFSSYNSITVNDCNYYEISHYRPKVSKLIAARIFNDKKVEIPRDFGIHVIKKNRKQHIKLLRMDLEKYKDGYF